MVRNVVCLLKGWGHADAACEPSVSAAHRVVLCQVGAKAQDFAIVHVMDGARHHDEACSVLCSGWRRRCALPTLAIAPVPCMQKRV